MNDNEPRTSDRTTTDRTGSDQMMERDTMRSGAKWLSGLASLLGAWIALSPWILDAELVAGELWNNVIIGTAIFLIAGYNYYRMEKGHTPSTGSSSLVALLGLWMAIAPFIMYEADPVMTWSNVLSGLTVALIGAYNAYAGRETTRATTTEGV